MGRVQRAAGLPMHLGWCMRLLLPRCQLLRSLALPLTCAALHSPRPSPCRLDQRLHAFGLLPEEESVTGAAPERRTELESALSLAEHQHEVEALVAKRGGGALLLHPGAALLPQGLGGGLPWAGCCGGAWGSAGSLAHRTGPVHPRPPARHRSHRRHPAAPAHRLQPLHD